MKYNPKGYKCKLCSHREPHFGTLRGHVLRVHPTSKLAEQYRMALRVASDRSAESKRNGTAKARVKTVKVDDAAPAGELTIAALQSLLLTRQKQIDKKMRHRNRLKEQLSKVDSELYALLGTHKIERI